MDVLKNFAKFTGNHLCWNHFLIKLQVSRPEITLKWDSSTGIFLWILRNFSKNSIEYFRITAPADSSVPSKVFPLILCFCFFLHFFPFIIIDNCHYRSLFRKGIKMKIFLLFTIIYSNIITNIVKTISPRQ